MASIQILHPVDHRAERRMMRLLGRWLLSVYYTTSSQATREQTERNLEWCASLLGDPNPRELTLALRAEVAS